MCIAPGGDDWTQLGCTQFGRLLHHEIRGIALQQREYQPQIWLLCLHTRPLPNPQRRTIAVYGFDLRNELAVAAVEQEDFMPRSTTHHGSQVVRLCRRGGYALAFGQRGGDVEAD